MVIINHPVHIVGKDGVTSPSALIPFCDFGGNMSAMGVKIDDFDVPVCNSFQAKILNDQICYEVDLNSFSDKDNIERYLKFGFIFLLDYNEDRQSIFGKVSMKTQNEDLAYRIAESNEIDNAFIYLDTIGKNDVALIFALLFLN